MRFLSDEWLVAAEKGLREHEAFQALAADSALRLQLIAEKPPPWANDVTVVVDHGAVSLEAGRGRCDASGRATYANWLAMLRHELHPRWAALTRKLRGHGIPAIVSHYKLVDTALDVLREIHVDE